MERGSYENRSTLFYVQHVGSGQKINLNISAGAEKGRVEISSLVCLIEQALNYDENFIVISKHVDTQVTETTEF